MLPELTPDQTRWLYNCYDIDYTLEVAEQLIKQMEAQPDSLKDFFNFQQSELAPALVNVMKRGVLVDQAKKEALKEGLSHIMRDVEAKLNWLIGDTYNPKSPLQTKNLFKNLLGVAPVQSKKGTDTFGAAAMVIYLQDYPMLRPLITLILEYRTLQVFVGTFLSAEVDEDGRMRSSYAVTGTSTYRLASRKNAFGRGMNLQNVPSKGKMDLRMSLASVDEFEGSEPLNMAYQEGITELPNCKQLFIPDPGYTFFDVDYSGADAMVVGWDSNCEWLINFFQTSKEKLYIYLGQEYLQRPMTTKDPLYKKFKAFCHGTNYGMGVEKAAATAGMAIRDARHLQKFYFGLCPEIQQWHDRIGLEIMGGYVNGKRIAPKGYIENIFGARGYFLNRKDPTILNKAYAYIPQSTIGIMVNKGLVNIEKEASFLQQSLIADDLYKAQLQLADKLQLSRVDDSILVENISQVQVLMQVHDSLAGQFKTTDLSAPERIVKHMSTELPYKVPLVIPAEIETSVKSYGDCG